MSRRGRGKRKEKLCLPFCLPQVLPFAAAAEAVPYRHLSGGISHLVSCGQSRRWQYIDGQPKRATNYHQRIQATQSKWRLLCWSAMHTTAELSFTQHLPTWVSIMAPRPFDRCGHHHHHQTQANHYTTTELPARAIPAQALSPSSPAVYFSPFVCKDGRQSRRLCNEYDTTDWECDESGLLAAGVNAYCAQWGALKGRENGRERIHTADEDAISAESTSSLLNSF